MHAIYCTISLVMSLDFVLNRYFTLGSSFIGLYDATVIRNGDHLINFQKESFVKIGWHLIIFFASLY